MTLNNLLKSLEDAAEVGVQLAEHQLSKDDAGNFKVKPIDNVCFALDAVRPQKEALQGAWVKNHDVFWVYAIDGAFIMLKIIKECVILDLDTIYKIIWSIWP